MDQAKAFEDIKAEAARYGALVEAGEGGSLILRHAEAPLYVEVRVEGGKATVELKVGPELNDYIESVIDEGGDPRGLIDDVVGEMLRLVDAAATRLAAEGLMVERRTREAILDVYDALEARLEEE